MSLTEEDLDAIRARAEAATPGPWEHGDRWHIQGASHCQCLESVGPLIREVRMNINGTMMQAHIHERPEPRWRHGITVAPSQQTGWLVGSIVNDTDEYGYMDDDNARFIAAARTDVPGLLAEVERLRAGIRGGLSESRTMQSEVRSSVTLAYLQSVLDELLNPTEGEVDEQPCCRYCGEPGSDHHYPCC